MSQTAHAPVDLGLVIAGERVDTGSTSEITNPARPGEVVGRLAAAGPEDSARAVQAAVDAFPAWSAVEPGERARLLVAALERLAEGRDERARLLTRENGKVVGESRVELHVFESRCRLAASLSGELGQVRPLARPGGGDGTGPGARGWRCRRSARRSPSCRSGR